MEKDIVVLAHPDVEGGKVSVGGRLKKDLKAVPDDKKYLFNALYDGGFDFIIAVKNRENGHLGSFIQVSDSFEVTALNGLGRALNRSIIQMYKNFGVDLELEQVDQEKLDPNSN